MSIFNSLSGSINLLSIPGAQLENTANGLAVVIPASQADVQMVTLKSGAQAAYLNLTLWTKRNVDQRGLDEYGMSHDIVLSYSKERKAALPQGTFAPTLGRAKPIVRRDAMNHPQVGVPQNAQPVQPTYKNNGTDVPF
jgi:hypothetical protein